MGISEERIDKFIDDHGAVKLTMVFQEEILPGYRAYKELIKKYKDKDHIYLMEYKGLGDTFVASAILDKKGFIGKNTVIVVPGQGAARAAALFPYGNIEILPIETCFAIRRFHDFLGKELKVEPLLYEPDHMIYRGMMRHMSGLKGLSFYRMMEIGICKNVKGYAGAKEIRTSCGARTAGKGIITASPDNQAVKKSFSSLGLTPGRTALLAPYINGHELNIDYRVYDRIAQILLEKGFTVCTNSSDPVKEPVIAGTKSLNLELSVITAFCEESGLFIGSRSGLCDVLSGADCKKLIIYDESEFIGMSTWREYFSLKNFNQAGTVEEFTLPNEQDGLLETIRSL